MNTRLVSPVSTMPKAVAIIRPHSANHRQPLERFGKEAPTKESSLSGLRKILNQLKTFSIFGYKPFEKLVNWVERTFFKESKVAEAETKGPQTVAAAEPVRPTQQVAAIGEKPKYNLDNVAIISGRGNTPLAEEVAQYLGAKLHKVKVKNFNGPGTEIDVKLREPVDGKNVFIIQPTCNPSSENLVEMMLLIDTAKRHYASRVTLVIPHYGYARGDRRVKNGEAIGSAVMAKALEAAGADEVMFMDIHAKQVEGNFRIPTAPLSAISVAAEHVMKRSDIKAEDLVLVSPDAGGMKRVETYADWMGIDDKALINKKRGAHSKIVKMQLIGEEMVKGKTVLLIDDMIDTGGTIAKAAKLLKEKGATRVLVLATHPVFSGDALKNMADENIAEVLVTNTIPLSEAGQKMSKITQLSIAPILGEAIGRRANNLPIADLCDFQQDDEGD